MAAATVALTRCRNYDPSAVAEAIARQFDLLGGLGRFVKSGDRVLLKPNFIAPRSHHQGPTQTHPQVILAMAQLVKDFGARPFVADSPAWANAAACARALELTEPLAKLGVPVRELDEPRICRLGPDKPRVKISAVALEADVVINLPKFKAHQQLVTTFAVKNLFGTVCGKRKAMWHFKKGDDVTAFCTLLIDIFRHVGPALTIIDGIVAMEGQGPLRGPNKPLGWLIAGTDPIACETVCCQLINVAPEQIPIIRTARQIGFGCADLEQIEIAGDGLPSQACMDFQMPVMAPIKFSFAHICRSVAKQIVLLARGAKAKRAQPADY
ncbi:MAG: DUF362 domain-containing protein [Phycisphaerales bacterium]|nr:MAG: DUF362 domain-containing protein [Phycisphaerales bacterium]